MPIDSSWSSFGGKQLRRYSLYCYINVPLCLFPPFIFSNYFKKEESGCSRHYSLRCLHQSLQPHNYSPSSVTKVNLPVPARRWVTVVSSVGLLARRCVYTDVSDTSSFLHRIHYVLLCVFFLSRKQNAVGLEGERSVLECAAWWDAWWWQACRIWYRCPPRKLQCVRRKKSSLAIYTRRWRSHMVNKRKENVVSYYPMCDVWRHSLAL